MSKKREFQVFIRKVDNKVLEIKAKSSKEAIEEAYKILETEPGYFGFEITRVLE